MRPCGEAHGRDNTPVAAAEVADGAAVVEPAKEGAGGDGSLSAAGEVGEWEGVAGAALTGSAPAGRRCAVVGKDL